MNAVAVVITCVAAVLTGVFNIITNVTFVLNAAGVVMNTVVVVIHYAAPVLINVIVVMHNITPVISRVAVVINKAVFVTVMKSSVNKATCPVITTAITVIVHSVPLVVSNTYSLNNYAEVFHKNKKYRKVVIDKYDKAN